MPVLEAQKRISIEAGSTRMPSFLKKSTSQPRQQFFKKYIKDSKVDKASITIKPRSSGKRILNMVYANKRERETERDVCKYIVTKVLNQGNLTRITGITTQNELVQY